MAKTQGGESADGNAILIIAGSQPDGIFER
jgi:hypothetical protein